MLAENVLGVLTLKTISFMNIKEFAKKESSPYTVSIQMNILINSISITVDLDTILIQLQ